jgi:hypothetical protein
MPTMPWYPAGPVPHLQHEHLVEDDVVHVAQAVHPLALVGELVPVLLEVAPEGGHVGAGHDVPHSARVVVSGGEEEVRVSA